VAEAPTGSARPSHIRTRPLPSSDINPDCLAIVRATIRLRGPIREHTRRSTNDQLGWHNGIKCYFLAVVTVKVMHVKVYCTCTENGSSSLNLSTRIKNYLKGKTGDPMLLRWLFTDQNGRHRRSSVTASRGHGSLVQLIFLNNGVVACEMKPKKQ
jgi:hypothetical protein